MSEEQKPVRIRADRDVCIGAGMCVMTADQIFDQDDDGVVVLLEPEPPAQYADLVRRAVRACPSGALSLVED
ncbi:ferredoxin [Streptosporangium sandarakinum]|uniref:Ferredoxin n=1 Tax=Streptosporangium sandarakinum TaxID=1260955 RepID=A0A852VBQ9_9ACTN|nr:(4Fe-4S)-binding protein [Streptosporangium sandarakinum]NYF44494.1 ferredoxin [Streptosporangium sandarakinum]